MQRFAGPLLLALTACQANPGVLLPASDPVSKDVVQVEATVTTEISGKSAGLAMPSVVRVICPQRDSGGTGFAHKSGVLITAAHVVAGCDLADLKIVVPSGELLSVASVVVEPSIDLAILRPVGELLGPTLPISLRDGLQIGDQLITWGHPAGYRGRGPLLTVGYLAGVDAPGPPGSPTQMVVNAAFNSGNSGGPVARVEDGTVVGVVSSKLAPLPPTIESAIEALSNSKSGFQYQASRANGEKESWSEAKVVSEVLKHLRAQTQLVIGYAVPLPQLRKFLEVNNINP
jgi:S1-C subfamily serine protease